MSSTSDYVQQLRTADLRVTRPRLAVLEAVHAHPHADTDTIFGAVRAGLIAFSVPVGRRPRVFQLTMDGGHADRSGEWAL